MRKIAKVLGLYQQLSVQEGNTVCNTMKGIKKVMKAGNVMVIANFKYWSIRLANITPGCDAKITF